MLVGAAKQSIRIVRLKFHLRRPAHHIHMTGNLTRPRDPASSPVPARPEKRPRLEITEEEDAVVEPSTSNMDEEDIPVAEPVDTVKATKKSKSKRRKQKRPIIEPYSSDDVLYHDVISLLKNSGKVIEAEKEWDAPLPFGTEVELVVSELSSTGMACNVFISFLAQPL
jgi:tRNA (uracil-5-)-methyltransferase